MKDNPYPNIVWFLVDGVRTYHTDGDLRGKLDFMERFGASSVEFSTCVTTAPSTIMSVTAMLTGLPAYFLARNYDDFRFDEKHYRSLRAVLKKHGYASYAFLRSFETRLKLKNLLDPIPRKYWLPHFRHRLKWPNEHLNLVLERLLHEGVSQPAFLFFHYNPQTWNEKRQPVEDPDLSARLQSAYEQLVSSGLTPENTIFVLCSDHGFPDPSTGLTTEWEARHRLTHDLVLTDDNILIPLYLRYPGCQPKKIETPVCSLDLFPTLLDLAGIPDSSAIQAEVDGESLVPLMESGDPANYGRRYFRCDARLVFQTGRATVIRSKEFKYIRFHDEHRLRQAGTPSAESEVLLNLLEDPEERLNLLLEEELPGGIETALAELRREFDRTEGRAVQFQVSYLLTRQGDILSSGQSPETAIRVLLIFEPGTAAYSQIASQAVARAIGTGEIHVLDDGSLKKLTGSAPASFTYVRGPNGSVSAPDELTKQSRDRYDLTLVFVQNPSSDRAAELLRIADEIPGRRRLVVDCNFNTYRRTRYWRYRFRSLFERLSLARGEPSLAVQQLKTGGQVMARHLLNKMGRWSRWRAANAEDTRE